MATLWGLVIAPIQWVLLAIIVYAVLETLGGNIALHRYFGHRSFKTSKTWNSILCFLGHYIGVGSVISWVGQHRHHHRHSDTKKDVHNYRDLGMFTLLFGIWEVNINRMLIRDVIKDNQLVWWHKHYWKFHILLGISYLIVDLVFGTYFLFALYAMPNLMCLISGYVLAITTHSHGYVTYDLKNDRSTNSWIANIYTLGEGWHNNHHANPTRLRQGEQWWEWDIPAFVVERFIKKHE